MSQFEIIKDTANGKIHMVRLCWDTCSDLLYSVLDDYDDLAYLSDGIEITSKDNIIIHECGRVFEQHIRKSKRMREIMAKRKNIPPIV